jgi:NAD-dependent SIR2 family protein deacetylase
MRISTAFTSVEPDDFARRFSMRGGRLMWLVGAGCSAAAGVPTAWDMVWEFKQQLYVSQRRVAGNRVSDLSNPAIRQLLQGHIDASGNLPPAEAPDEYAALFEAVWPHERDRQTYLDGKLKGAKPSYGHLAMASLMKAGQLKLVWTTNFDPLIADASAKVFDSTGALTTVTLDGPELAAQVITSERWPVEVKLHGELPVAEIKKHHG